MHTCLGPSHYGPEEGSLEREDFVIPGMADISRRLGLGVECGLHSIGLMI